MNGLIISKLSSNQKKVTISFIIIFLVGLGLRLFYLPHELPLIADGMDNFTYATAINYYEHLPLEWTPANNGWPIFLSFWFSIISLDNSLEYMQMQRVVSVILSSFITIPVYFLCKKFFNPKIALIGAALFSFDPRIILNSILGITEPLFIILGVSSLVIFLKYGRKEIIFSFILASLCTIVRSEGIFLLMTLTILFFIKYKISKEILKTYLPSLVIFLLILTPIAIYKIDVSGNDAIFQRAVAGSGQIVTMVNEGETNKIFAGVELFVKYLGWIMIPSFLVFLPFGIIQFFRKRTSETNFIIIFLICSSIPLLYAYIVQAQDTRYFYFLYPIFCLVSLYAVQTYISKFSKKNTIIVLIVIGILISSVGFYEYKKIDYEKEIELNEISKIISMKIDGANFHPTESKYIRAAQIPSNWPFVFTEDDYKINVVHVKNEKNLEDFIFKNRNEITHIITDNNSDLPGFLQDIYNNEKKYKYLEKEFDSQDMGFNQQIKVFKINFDIFDIFLKK